MLYEVKNGTVSLGGNEILSHFNFRMVDNEKIGIVGRNGAGKTTLLKLMNGDIGLDYNDDNTMGEIVKSKDYNVGFLKQQLAGHENVAQVVRGDGVGAKLCEPAIVGANDVSPLTAYQYLLSSFQKLIDMEVKIEKISDELNDSYDEKKANELNTLIDTYNFEGGHTYIKELKTGFKKFGFLESDSEKKVTEFSGGQATKISLLKLLLSKPDVLLLDEPTNHLDIEAIEWMENYLRSYKKNVVVVSHDRMFLDNICSVIYDIENKEAVRYDGNYTDFVEQKQINYELKLAEYNKNLKEIERLTALADRFRYKATKARMVQSKDKVIEKLEAKTFKPTEADTKTFHVKIVPRKTGGKEVLRCSNLIVGYGSTIQVVHNDSAGSDINNVGAKHCEPASVRASSASPNIIAKINLTVTRHDRLAVIGANGTGKSTFIKTIVGVIPKLAGEYEYGHEIEYEYFDQRIAENNSTKTLFDDFSDEFPMYTNTEVRNRLGRFLFGEEDISKRVCDLSGGEKVRLCLSKIFERRPNLLILDEPTNHLDILGKESLEEILDSFEGTVILVSHDRYFVKKTSNKILYFEKENNSNENVAHIDCGDDVVDNSADLVVRGDVGAKLYEPLCNTKFFEFGYEDYEKYVKEKELDDVNANETHIVHDDSTKAYSADHAARGDDVVATQCKPVANLSNKDNYQLNKQKNKDQKKMNKLEAEIEKIEAEIEQYNSELLDEKIQSDFAKLTSIHDEISRLNEELENKYVEWESLSNS